MVICHFIAGAIAGGAENLVKDLAIKQVELGAQVHVILLNNARSVSRCEKYENEYILNLKANGVLIHSANNLGFLRVYRLLYSFKNDYKELNEKIIVHCHLLVPLFIALFLPKKFFKVIYTHHSINLKLHKIFYRIASVRTDGFIGISKTCTEILRCAVQKDVKLIYNAADPKKIKKKLRKSSHPISPLKIIMVGSFRFEKNYESLIIALENANYSPDQLHIDVFGEGEGRSIIKDQIEKKGLSDLITLMGNSSSISQEYANYDCFLICSVSEGLPISLIEASIAGLPVITTDVGGCKEIIDILDNGFILPGTTPSLIQEGISKVLDLFCKDMDKVTLNYKSTQVFHIDWSAKQHILFYNDLK